jgi:hypothetical protein
LHPLRALSPLRAPITNATLGFGYHGDFVTGWEVPFLQNAVDTCTNLSGEMSDCPLFTLQDASVSDACQFPIPDNLKADNPMSPGTTLPGNVQVVSSGGVVPSAVPTLSYSAGASTDIAGGIFVASGSYSPSPTATTPAPAPTTPSPSPTPAPTTNPLLPGESIVSTMYTTLADKNEVMELVMVELQTTVYVSTTATVMTTVTERRRRKHRRHGHAHAHEGS